MKPPELKFRWKYKCYELRACPERLVAMYPGEPNTTIDLVMWDKYENGKDYCFSLAFFVRGKEGYSLRFVGPRPFENVDGDSLPVLWKGLKLAQKALNVFFYQTEGKQ